MIVVDTSALIAILQSEPEAEHFLDVLERSAQCLIGAPTRFEALLVTARHPTGQADLLTLIDELAIEIVDWTSAHADFANCAFLEYGKGQHPAKLNFGDCMAYALAKSMNAPLLFKGDDFALTDVRRAA